MNAAVDWFSLSGSTTMSLHFCAWSSLVARTTESRIPSGGAGVPLSTWNGSLAPVIGARRASDIVSGWHLRSSTTALVNDGTGRAWDKLIQQSTTVRFQLRPLVVCPRLSPSHRHCLISEENTELIALLSRHSIVLLFHHQWCSVLNIHICLYRDLEVLRNYTSRKCRSYLHYITYCCLFLYIRPIAELR